ncbi:glycosyltransferase family A protein [Brevibacillus choshinensis]|uniref:glycosyltransferase family A protein n=1 Tax=Brevibacillus choshinensis TaxID=54911 RepID=UPI002E1E1CA9|nr:glycosyltransferase family A protein [Brevibacillus choshinensis]
MAKESESTVGKRKKRIIVGIAFNSKKLKYNRKKRFSESWIKNRMNIFMRYTRKSLQRQTNQGFDTLVEYEDRSRTKINRQLRKYKKLPKNIKFIPKSIYQRSIKKRLKGYRYLYLVRLDSDDLYRRSYIQQLKKHRKRKGVKAIINQHGYMYDSRKQRIAPMYAKSPAFYTLIYKAKDYLRGKRYKLRGGHPAVIRLRHDKLRLRNYVHIIHSGNTTSKFRSKRNKVINKRLVVKGRHRVRRILSSFM